MKDTVYKYEVN